MFQSLKLSKSVIPSLARHQRTVFQPAVAYSTQHKTKVTLIPGDGIGPEIAEAVVNIFDAAKVPVVWDEVNVGFEEGYTPAPGELLAPAVHTSFKETQLGLKGPLGTPIGKGHVSLNLALRKTFNLFANVRPARSIPNLSFGYSDVDVVVVRENTEGEYSGIEHMVKPGVAQSIKLITKDASIRVAKHAFEYAVAQGRKRITAVHKANIMKMSDGLFLEACDEAAAAFPQIKYEKMTVDNACLLLTKDPSLLDVMVLPNLYGDIVSDLCAGLIGGLGLTPSANIGDGAAIFEAVHGTAPDIAGQGKANPTALLLSAVMMLRHIGLHKHANKIHKSTLKVLGSKNPKVLTGDLGGKASTKQYTNAVIDEILD